MKNTVQQEAVVLILLFVMIVVIIVNMNAIESWEIVYPIGFKNVAIIGKHIPKN